MIERINHDIKHGKGTHCSSCNDLPHVVYIRQGGAFCLDCLEEDSFRRSHDARFPRIPPITGNRDFKTGMGILDHNL